MNLAITVIQIVAPVFLLAAIGWAWVKAGYEYRIRFVTQLAMTLSVPCLVFNSLQNAKIDASALAVVFLASIASYACLSIAMYVLVRVMRLEIRTYLAPMIFGNTGNLGLPLALFAFGQEGLAYAIVIFAVMAVYSFSAGVWIVAGGGSIIKVIREPMVAAALLGCLFLWQGWTTPLFLSNTLELIGQMAIPLMLITLGVALARLAPEKVLMPVILSVLKVVFSVCVAWAVGTYFALPPVALAVLVLQVATPVAITSYLIAEKYEADAASVAGLVVVSTLVSVLALPLIIAFVI